MLLVSPTYWNDPVLNNTETFHHPPTFSQESWIFIPLEVLA